MKPIHLAEYNITVPCKRCRLCKIARAREWAQRVVHETQYHKDSSFVTLTYNDENLPLSLDKAELQKFFKRLREHLDGRKIKYIACGEYGEEKARPHYHAIIFGIGIDEHEVESVKKGDVSKGFKVFGGPLKKAWDKGFIVIGTVTRVSALYVMNYMQKVYNGPLERKVYADKIKPFQLQSQGLGLSYAAEQRDRITRELGLTVQGVPVGLPSYYIRKLFNDEDKARYHEKARERHFEVIQKKLEKGFGPYSVNREIHKSLWQHGLTVIEGHDIRKKRIL